MKKRNTSLRFVTEKNKERKRVTTFTAALVGFIIVFGAVSGFILLKANDYSFSKLIGSPEAESELPKGPEKVLPEMPELVGSVNILFMGLGGDDIEYGVVLHCDVEDVKITVCPFETGASASVNGRTDTFSGHYEYGGEEQVVKAVEQGLSVKIDRYIFVTKSGLCDLVKALGGIPMNFEKPLSYNGDDFSLNLKAGKQTVSGESFYKYLKYPDSSKENQLANQGKAFCAMVDAVLTMDNILDGDEFFSSVINCTKSDISVEDYLKNERVLEYFIKSEKRKANEVSTEFAQIR